MMSNLEEIKNEVSQQINNLKNNNNNNSQDSFSVQPYALCNDNVCQGGCQGVCGTVCDQNCNTRCDGTCKSNCALACSSCGSGCSKACSSCGSACTKGCAENCTYSCSGSCDGTCKGGCYDTCKGGCTGTCHSGCDGGCYKGCTGNCKSECSGGCYNTCFDNCSGTCKPGCQVYCMSGVSGKSQVFSTRFEKTFAWSPEIESGKIISITASDWNKLIGYVEDAGPYCCGKTISITGVNSNDYITAKAFNDLDNGIFNISDEKIGQKTKDVDYLYAKDFQALADNYNSALIIGTLSCGETTACAPVEKDCPTTCPENKQTATSCPQSPGS